MMQAPRTTAPSRIADIGPRPTTPLSLVDDTEILPPLELAPQGRAMDEPRLVEYPGQVRRLRAFVVRLHRMDAGPHGRRPLQGRPPPPLGDFDALVRSWHREARGPILHRGGFLVLVDRRHILPDFEEVVVNPEDGQERDQNPGIVGGAIDIGATRP